ncbi:unnamed protein product, partial [Meganyctiphanes norvegica]
PAHKMSRAVICIAILVAVAAVLVTIYKKTDNDLEQGETPYLFNVEWYDGVSATERKFRFSFFPRDKSVQLYDLQAQKIFLKRVCVQGIEERDLYLGNTVVVFSRQLKLIAYADNTSKEILEARRQRTFAMVKPDAVHRLGEVIDVIQSRDFEVSQMKMVQVTRQQAAHFYQEHQGRPFFEPLLDYITGGPVVALELLTSNAVKRWRETLGPTDALKARTDAPESIRAKFGLDKQSNAAHGSDSDTAASREINFFFPTSTEGRAYAPQTTAKFQDSTCCIIKPHAIQEGKLGSIITAIKNEGYEITALQMFRMTKLEAEEFLEVYKGVVNEYPGMVQQLMSGPCVAMEIRSIHVEVTPSIFREFVGPNDPVS